MELAYSRACDIGAAAKDKSFLSDQSPLALTERIIKGSPVPTLVLDREQKILVWNDACEFLTGIPAAAVLGLSAATLDLSPGNTELFAALLTTHPVCLETGELVLNSETRDAAGRATIKGWFTDLNGKNRFLLIRSKPLFAADGAMSALIKTIFDLTEVMSAERSGGRQRQVAADVPDRNLLNDRLTQAIVQAKRDDSCLALFWLRVKSSAEDSSLREVRPLDSNYLQALTERLKSEIRAIDTLVYCGNSEFAILASNFKQQEYIADLAYRLAAAFPEPVRLDGETVPYCCKIGISVFPEDGEDAEALTAAALEALQKKQFDQNVSLQFHNEALHTRYAQHLFLQTQLKTAIKKDELSLHYQPKACLQTGRMTGLEALMRWHNPQLGAVSPAEFIPLAERLGLIDRIGKWAFKTACEQLNLWRKQGLAPPPVAINLSGKQLKDPEFVPFVRQVLAQTKIAPNALELEVTETAVVGDMQSAIATLEELKRLGLSISLDDFGTGYSSLSYLRQLPIDKIKIDRSFINDVTREPSSAEITKATIAIAHALRIKVIAEGVETEEQLSYLQRLGCDEIQGYLYSRPLESTKLAELLLDRPCIPLNTDLQNERRILVVDDEPAIRNCLRRELATAGYVVETAAGAEEGLSVLAQRPCQVVIADYFMPEVNGVLFLERVKKIYPDTVRVAISGSFNIDILADNINRGAIFKFISKPWDKDELLAIIEESFTYQACKEGKISCTP